MECNFKKAKRGNEGVHFDKKRRRYPIMIVSLHYIGSSIEVKHVDWETLLQWMVYDHKILLKIKIAQEKHMF